MSKKTINHNAPLRCFLKATPEQFHFCFIAVGRSADAFSNERDETI